MKTKIENKNNKMKVPSYLTSHSRPHKLRKFIADEKILIKLDNYNIISTLVIGKPKEIKKKDLSWSQAKRRNPKLDPYKDSDKDGVINLLDKRPLDKKIFKNKLKGGKI